MENYRPTDPWRPHLPPPGPLPDRLPLGLIPPGVPPRQEDVLLLNYHVKRFMPGVNRVQTGIHYRDPRQ